MRVWLRWGSQGAAPAHRVIRVAPASTCKLVADGHVWHRARPKFKAGALRDMHLRMCYTETRPLRAPSQQTSKAIQCQWRNPYRHVGVAPAVGDFVAFTDDAARFTTTGTYLLAANSDTLSA
jgi:hypothetical protein